MLWIITYLYLIWKPILIVGLYLSETDSFNPLKIIITHGKTLIHKSSLKWIHFKITMSRAMNWVLLQLAMTYYGDSLKEFQVENDWIFKSWLTFWFLIASWNYKLNLVSLIQAGMIYKELRGDQKYLKKR